MTKDKVAALRIPAFFIDFVIVMVFIGGALKIANYLQLISGSVGPALLTGVCVPLGFFFYWGFGIHLGKRLFRLKIVDAATAKTPTTWQYFKRCLLFTLVIPFNLVFLIPLFVSKNNQSFHDMLANTLVVSKTSETTLDAKER